MRETLSFVTAVYFAAFFAVVQADTAENCPLSQAQLVHNPDCCVWTASTKVITCYKRTYYDRESKTNKPVTYSLDKLDSKDGYQKKDKRHGFTYYFDFGSKYPSTPDSCTTTRGDDGKSLSGPAAGYQVCKGTDCTDQNFNCHRITGDPTNTDLMNIRLIDDDPAQGFVLTIQGGDFCNITDWSGHLTGRSRSMVAFVRCSTEPEHQGKVIESVESISEIRDCIYQLDLYSSYGCPTTCAAGANGKVCNGPHGQCKLDLDSNEATCLCDHNAGYYGPSCDSKCAGFVENGDDCSGHGHCGYDYGSKSAHCFCEAGYSGDDCNGSVGAGGAATAGWVFFALIICALAALYVYHKRTIDEPLCPCGNGDGGGQQTYGRVDSTMI